MMLPRHEALFSPSTIGNHAINNRLVLAPTYVGSASEKGGRVTDQTLCYYYTRAKAGVGLVIVEVTGITGRHAFSPGLGLGAASDKSIPGLSDLARVIHWGGAKGIVQLTLGQGAQAFYHHRQRPLVGPSDIPAVLPVEGLPKNISDFCRIKPEIPVPVSTEDIRLLTSDVLRAAGRVLKAGFEGIELHGAHGYLLSQFTSPYFNRRRDEYGGSRENRHRLSVEIVRQLKEALGMNAVIGYRLSAREWIPGGAGLSDSVRLSQRLEGAGIDYISVSQGCFGSVTHVFPAGEDTITADAEKIKNEVSIPVMCANFQNPDTAARAVENGSIDFVALSRALLSDPYWIAKVRQGKPETIRKCIRCYQCIEAANLNHLPVRCPVNPVLGFERFDPDCRPVPPL
ncbi:MAG: NADH:flavin oxidoreductase [Desulfobacterales bacterium]